MARSVLTTQKVATHNIRKPLGEITNTHKRRQVPTKTTPIKDMKIMKLTEERTHVEVLFGERLILGEINKKALGKGSEKTVLDVNFEACDRHYALNIAHPKRRVKSDLDGLYFGVKQVSDDSTLGLSRIAVGDLRHLIQQNPTLPVSTQLDQIIIPFLKTLKTIHDQDLVHCDIKLENALYKLDENGNYMVEPSDLGMAQTIDDKRRFAEPMIIFRLNYMTFMVNISTIKTILI